MSNNAGYRAAQAVTILQHVFPKANYTHIRKRGKSFSYAAKGKHTGIGAYFTVSTHKPGIEVNAQVRFYIDAESRHEQGKWVEVGVTKSFPNVAALHEAAVTGRLRNMLDYRAFKDRVETLTLKNAVLTAPVKMPSWVEMQAAVDTLFFSYDRRVYPIWELRLDDPCLAQWISLGRVIVVHPNDVGTLLDALKQVEGFLYPAALQAQDPWKAGTKGVGIIPGVRILRNTKACPGRAEIQELK